jgi:hypothetical protein
MTIASRTPEGQPNTCPICGALVLIEPSHPAGDAPCPRCGNLLWFLNHRFVSPPPGCQVERQRLLGRNAAGGEVWAGAGPGLTTAAIEIMPLARDADDVDGLCRTLEWIQRLRHPNLLEIRAFWTLDDRLVILTELAEESLRDLLQARRETGLPGMPARKLVPYFREAARALDYLHGHQVCHRDVKPAHLVVINHHVKVAGLAAIVHQYLRSPPSSGTPLYFAPEVWHGRHGVSSDQYSLAVSYAELRLGRPVFAATDMVELMLAHLASQPDLAPLPTGEQGVLGRALAKEATQRFPNCRQFTQALADATGLA